MPEQAPKESSRPGIEGDTPIEQGLMSGKGRDSEPEPLATHALGAQGLWVELPGENFSREQTYNGWSFVEDRAKGVSLWARLSLARRSVNLAECDEQATSSLSILRKKRSALKRVSTFQTEHFFGALWGLGLPSSDEASGEPAERLWVVFAVSTGRCLSAVYAVKPSADAAVWLAVGRELVLPSLRSAEVQDRALGVQAVP